MRIIILAAGKGTRMNLGLPKVLAPLAGRTIIEHVIEHVLGAEVDAQPIVVVGHQAEKLREVLAAYPVQIVEQKEQLGTGHAVQVCRDEVDPKEDVMVLCGDHPLLSSATIGGLADEHEIGGATITLMNYTVPDFDVYGGAFNSFGRIARNTNGAIRAICEAKDATAEELKIKEINSAHYVFSGPWLWANIGHLEPKNALHEYYLTDLLTMAVAQGGHVAGVAGTDLREAVGVNTMKQLFLAEILMTSL
ncbi:MAG: NTP transferase domain-containing protein [Parcubacteria group bacterium]|nr:NTP transferase domain-containing protein [Parcubacteria group bacterium]